MKHFTLISKTFLAALIGCTILFTACSNGTGGTSTGITNTVYLASENYSEFTTKTLSMCSNIVYTKDKDKVPDTFIIKGDDIFTLNTKLDELMLLIQTCFEGKNVIIEKPSQLNMSALTLAVLAAIEAPDNEEFMAKYEGKDESLYMLIQQTGLFELPENESEPSELSVVPAYEAIAIRQKHLYCVHDIKQCELMTTDEKTTLEEILYDSEGTEIEYNQDDIPEEIEKIDSDDYSKEIGYSAKAFAEWIDNFNNESFSKRMAPPFARDGETDSDDYILAQTFTDSYIASTYKDYIKELVEVTVDVWAGCEIKYQKDYYLVHTNIVAHNEQLNYSYKWRNAKISPDEKWGYLLYPTCITGPFMKFVNVSQTINGHEAIIQTSPKTIGLGTTAITAEGNWEIDSYLGLAGSGENGGRPNGKVFKSSTFNAEGLSISNGILSLNKNSWVFSSPILKHSVEYMSCEEPPAITHDRASFDSYQLLVLDSDKKIGDSPDTIPLTTDINTNLSAITDGKSFRVIDMIPHYSCTIVEHERYTRYNKINTVRKPNNVRVCYIMDIEPLDENCCSKELFLDSLKRRVEHWYNEETYYGRDGSKIINSTKNRFAHVKKEITAQEGILQEDGVYGKFKVYLKDYDTSEIIDSIVYDIPKIKK